MLEFIEIYNLDGTYNSLLNINFIVKIKNSSITMNLNNNKKFYIIEYLDSNEALIKEKDYLRLTGKNKQEKQETKKEGTKK